MVDSVDPVAVAQQNIQMRLRTSTGRYLIAIALLVAYSTAIGTQIDVRTTPNKNTVATTAAELSSLRSIPDVRAMMEKTLRNLRYVEGGSFQMGDFGPVHSAEGLPYNTMTDNKPLHKVTLDSFSIAAYKTTYDDFDTYSRATGRPLIGQDDVTMEYRIPTAAAGVTWVQAREYCQWLGALLELPMDLPTEAQWEYAARNRGQLLVYATDNGKVDPGRNVWEFDQREAAIAALRIELNPPSLPLGQFPPTPLGLYDMMTDGFEWTLDWYDQDYYAVSPELNPTGPAAGTSKVLRSYRSRDGAGLAWGDGMTFTRNSRSPNPPQVSQRTNQSNSQHNPTPDTSARCVVNSQKAINAP